MSGNTGERFIEQTKMSRNTGERLIENAYFSRSVGQTLGATNEISWY